MPTIARQTQTAAAIRPRPQTNVRSAAGVPRSIVSSGPTTLSSKGAYYGLMALAVVAGTALFTFVRPFFTAKLGANHSLELGGDVPGPEGSVEADTQRRQALNRHVAEKYLMQGDGKIDWSELSDISDYIALRTRTDHDFRRDLWSVVGWDWAGRRVPISRFLDKSNAGLSPRFHNTDRQGKPLYKEEQMHHYLGAVTGNIDTIPSHLLQNPLWAALYEVKEWFSTGRYNWGDVQMTWRALSDRDDFLRYGRFAVGTNMRRLLVEG